MNDIRDGVTIAAGCDIVMSSLAHVTIGQNCHLSRCYIKGTPEAPIVIGDNVELIDTEIQSFPASASFQFGGFQVASAPVTIGEGTTLRGARIENSRIGARVSGTRCHVLNSHVGDDSKLRPHASLTLTHSAPHCNLGSELSKTILTGEGFTSEHTASYLSLIAPSAYPIVQADGTEILLEGLPNLTNIGAGTVFANYSGKPKPAASLAASSGSLKGTSISYGAFTAVNSVIVNRYGSAEADQPFAWLRQRDLTILGLGCFVEGKVTGRIPAFSYAGGTQSSDIKLGWVLAKQPGIVLNIVKKMQKRLGGEEMHRLEGLIEGTIRLELRLLEEQQSSEKPFYPKDAIDKAIARFTTHLDGRWAIDGGGQLVADWGYDELLGRWAAR